MLKLKEGKQKSKNYIFYSVVDWWYYKLKHAYIKFGNNLPKQSSSYELFVPVLQIQIWKSHKMLDLI